MERNPRQDKEPTKAIKDNWILCQSKSQPGRSYYFNQATGITQWNIGTGDGADCAITKPWGASTSTNKKNLAQNRLKKFQQRLMAEMEGNNNNESVDNKNGQMKAERKIVQVEDVPSTSSSLKRRRSDTSSTSGPMSNFIRKSYSDEIPTTSSSVNRTISNTSSTSDQMKNVSTKSVVEDTPTTSSSLKSTNASTISKSESMKNVIRKSYVEEAPTTSSSVKRTASNKSIKDDISQNGTSKLSRKRSATSSCTSVAEVRGKTSKLAASESSPSVKRPVPLMTFAKDTSPTSAQPRSNGIASKFKAICKPAPKIAVKALESANTHRESFKPAKKKICEDSPLAKPMAMQQVLTEFQQFQNGSSPTTSEHSLPRTPKNTITPRLGINSANARLESIRAVLQRQNCEMTPNCRKDASDAQASPVDEDEPMDWQPLENNESPTKNQASNKPSAHYSSLANQHGQSARRSLPDMNSMGEYYDMVNENLLRLSSEKSRASSSPEDRWLSDHYYFVVDTNVLLRCLTFVNDLSEMRFCKTSGSIIYLPYCVLQELDKLKMRINSESAKTLASRAIKYLNTKFEANYPYIKAQSAVEERNHSIEVASADDSIINCCLQVKQKVPQVLLLSEDVNLRNKAICNGILTSTKSDLISLHSSNAAVQLAWSAK